MESAVKIATYIASRYHCDYGSDIDEMKLHKLLYFSQRESFVQFERPLFHEQFRAWKYGPVMTEIRDMYRFQSLTTTFLPIISPEAKVVMDVIFTTYANKDSWSLSRLTHGEYSWQNARKGLAPMESCAKLIRTEDIRIDANRIKMRRYFLEKMNNKICPSK